MIFAENITRIRYIVKYYGNLYLYNNIITYLINFLIRHPFAIQQSEKVREFKFYFEDIVVYSKIY